MQALRLNVEDFQIRLVHAVVEPGFCLLHVEPDALGYLFPRVVEQAVMQHETNELRHKWYESFDTHSVVEQVSLIGC
jgi:hypothetical protein